MAPLSYCKGQGPISETSQLQNGPSENLAMARTSLDFCCAVGVSHKKLMSEKGIFRFWKGFSGGLWLPNVSYHVHFHSSSYDYIRLFAATQSEPR